MATVELRVGERAHIVVDSEVCRSCTTRACVTASPANLFAPSAVYGLGGPEELSAHQPMGRLLEPGEVAAAACWLCCERSPALTGSVLHDDGGFPT